MHTHLSTPTSNVHNHKPHPTRSPSSSSPSSPSPPPPPWQEAREDFTRLQLFLLTCGLIGLQFSWAVQVGYVTKTLLEFKLSPNLVSYAWLAGPIAGIVVQPIVGTLSDSCSHRLGRRRPFLILGSSLSCICLLLFAYAAEIGGHTYGLFIAILSFWLLDFAINSAQGPLRALLADVVPTKQHNKGNAYFAMATGIGNFTGSILGSVKLSTWFPFNLIFTTDLQALFSFAALFLLFTMSCTVLSTKEIPLLVDQHAGYDYESVDYDINDSTSGGIEDEENKKISFWKAGLLAPYPFWHTFTIQCFIWFGWFSLYVFGTSWVGAEVYNGSPQAPPSSQLRSIYDAGVRTGNLGLALQSVVTMITAPLLPFIIERTSSHFIYVVSSFMLSFALLSAIFINERWMAWIAVLVFGSTGVAWAVTMTVPWSLMGEGVARFAPQKAGVYYTMFNLSQCFPEVVVSIAAAEILRIFGKQSSVLAVGGIAVFIAGILIMVLGVGKNGNIHNNNFDNNNDNNNNDNNNNDNNSSNRTEEGVAIINDEEK